MSLLADYLRRVRDRQGAASRVAERSEATNEGIGNRRVTLPRLALSAAVVLLGAAVVRRLRRGRD